MAPNKRSTKGKSSKALLGVTSGSDGSPPAPFKRPPEILQPFIDGLSEKHVYITHIDSKPAEFKRKIFLVPVAMNIGIVALFVWRVYAIWPWYWNLVLAAFGWPNNVTFPTSTSSWSQITWEIVKRTSLMVVDFVLAVFISRWPIEFAAGKTHGNPLLWRRKVGFRNKEIYVRRSRNWDETLTDIFKDEDSKKIFNAYVNAATSPMLQEEKTGYLLMNGQWALDWAAMVSAHTMVDKKQAAIEAFKNVILVYRKEFGWLCYDIRAGGEVEEDGKRKQVFAFRDALTSMGKEDLFYRWVEMVQFEATQPSGFGPKQQEETAKKIREMFEAAGVDFDEVWKEAVGE